MAEDSVVQVPSRSQRRAKPRWQRRKAARPGEIVAAALQVFADHGFATSTLEEVARRAGVTKGTVYLYFDSKEALLKSVVRETIVPAIAQGEALAQSFTGSARELLTQIIRDFWQFLSETPASALPKLMVAEAANFPELARFYYQEVVSRGQRLIGSVLERGIKSGEFRSIDVGAARRLAIAPVLHAAYWRHSFALCTREDFDSVAYLNQHIDIFLRGIAKQAD
jgi:AcrR family transcriptional regulator